MEIYAKQLRENICFSKLYAFTLFLRKIKITFPPMDSFPIVNKTLLIVGFPITSIAQTFKLLFTYSKLNIILQHFFILKTSKT